MKKVIPFISALLISFSIQSQEIDNKKEIEQSQAAIFSSKAGTLIEKQFMPVGEIYKTKLEIIKLTDIISGQSVKALRLKKILKTSYSTKTKVTSLDVDEIDALIKSLEIIKEKVLNTTPTYYTEITFRSREGFEAGCYYTITKNAWILYFQIDKYNRDSIVRMDNDKLHEVLELLKVAKKQLG